MSSYRPLPSYLTIAESKIDGLGLHTMQKIGAAEYIGVTHIYYREDWVRTPLGGFINHSAYPNADHVSAWRHRQVPEAEGLERQRLVIQ